MGKKITNPFTSKKKTIINTIISKKKEEKETPVVKEKSTYTKPGDPYTIKSKLINCTPVIPVMYKAYISSSFRDPSIKNNDSIVNASYKEMYKQYNDDKAFMDLSYTRWINIIIGLKIEMDNTNKDRIIVIKKALDRFISDWSAYYREDHNHSVAINHKVRNDNIEEVNILIYGSLGFYHYYFNTLFDGINSIGSEILRTIASSNLIYRDIILDEESITGAKMTIRSMFMDPIIQSKIDADQYDSSDLKTYVDSFYNSTKDNNVVNILYIDNIDQIKKNIKEFFGENYDILFDIITHIYNMTNILINVKDPRTNSNEFVLEQEKLYEFLCDYFHPNQTDENRENNVFLNTIKNSLEDHFDFKINLFNKYSFYQSYSDTASYDDVDEVVEEEEIL